MGKTYYLGEGAFSRVNSVDELQRMGFISGVKANKLIFEHICNKTYEDMPKYQKYTEQLSKTLNKVQVGQGHGIRYYYKENEVNAFIHSILNGDEEIKVLTQDTNDLKTQGYISGTVVGDRLYKAVKQLCANDSSKNWSNLYKVEFRKLQKSVEKKTVGVGKATRHYYKESEVNQYIERLLGV